MKHGILRNDLLILDDGVVDDVSPQVGEDEGAGHQQVEDCDLDLPYCEGKAKNVKTGKTDLKVTRYFLSTDLTL